MQEWSVPGYRIVRDLRPHAGPGRSVLALHEASGLPVTLRFHDEPEQRLRSDAQALAGITSPHVAPLYEHVEVMLDGHAGAATARQYVEGASVRPLLPKLAHAGALAILRAGLLALDAAHARGVTHRGYKPENLLVDTAGAVRLADFAIAPPPPQTPEPTGYREDDVRAAFAVFVECVVGPQGGAQKLPRKLRGLAPVAVPGDGAALLEAVSRAGHDAWGSQWLERAQRELSRLVSKVR